jgi:Na+-translocating ferredoxin:NAD+ oxidoreductase RnfD subunit
MASQSRVLEANTATWDRRAEPEHSQPVLPLFLRTPKGQLLCVFGVLLLIAAPSEGGLALVPQLLAAVTAACAVDVAYTYWETRRWIVPTSALLSGLIVAFILGPQEVWQVVAWVAGFASVAKHVFANRREHIFNPAAIALVASVIIFGTGQSWWGALGDLPEPVAVVLVVSGVFIVDRLNKFPTVLAFLGVYFTAFAVASWFNAATVAEMFRSPFLQSALFLAFFMLTDPPTSPNRFADQVWYGFIAALVAVASQLLGVGQVYLLLGVLAANLWLAVRRWQARRPVTLTPQERRRARRRIQAQAIRAG